MIKKYPYRVWVIGAIVAWAVVLLLTWRFISTHRFHQVLIFFFGFWLGVLEARLARKVSKE
ncbi:MAG TPA: hypothetical protein VGS28_02385 [Candidatus Saccharimonadales bacterium]|nr:hypothetical protein [Candidatus Saccharimonadales bacterium]